MAKRPYWVKEQLINAIELLETGRADEGRCVVQTILDVLDGKRPCDLEEEKYYAEREAKRAAMRK